MGAKCFDGMTFSFNGKSSEMFGLYMGWRNVNEEWTTGLEREVVRTEMNMSRHIPNQFGAKYSNVIVMQFDIFHQDGSPFDLRESSLINNWLIHDSYKRLKIDDNNVDNVYYNVICTNIADITMGNFCGKAVTMTCDAPFGYMQDTFKTLDGLSSGTASWKMNNTSDDGIYYPIVTVECASNYTGNVELVNETENRTMKFSMANITAANNKKKLTLDMSKMLVLDADSVPVPIYKLGWSITPDPTKAMQSSPIHWFRLLPGVNNVKVKGNAKATFKFSFPRKVGQLNEERLVSM